jgi:hypothetical protein
MAPPLAPPPTLRRALESGFAGISPAAVATNHRPQLVKRPIQKTGRPAKQF